MEIWRWSASEMLARLDAGQVSSVALVEALHRRADAVEPKVHAFTAQYREAALARAREADEARARGVRWGPLHGLPISVKENLALVGTPQTVGVKARLNRISTVNAPVVQAALDAGAIVLGKTNAPQLLLSMETHNDIWGTTVNPWSARRVPGGSSGGEGAAIAAGMSPAGIGTDIGGSIRIPAAWCGICGIKPTWGRWSVYGSQGGQPGQEAVKSQSGPMARTVADVILLMKALGPDVQHGLDPLVPPVPLPDPGEVDVRRLKVGVYEDDGVFRPAASVRRAVREAADALAAAGAEVVPYAPPRSWEMFEAYFGLMSADGMVTARKTIEGEPITPQLATLAKMARVPRWIRLAAAKALAGREPRVSRLLSQIGEKRVHETWALTVQREVLKRAELAAWQEAGIDLLLGPATVTPAALLGETHDWSAGAWHTMRWNLLDQPAGIVPVSVVRPDEERREDIADRLDRKAATFEAGSAGMPVSVQVIGRPWDEHLVLAAMLAVERHLAEVDTFPRTPIDPRP